jgi:hypothetical protein
VAAKEENPQQDMMRFSRREREERGARKVQSVGEESAYYPRSGTQSHLAAKRKQGKGLPGHMPLRSREKCPI